MVEILTDLEIGEFEIKLSHRKLLSAMTQLAGVPPEKFKPVCSAIDKLDKEPWEAVRQELTEEKGIPGEVADRIWEFVQHRGDVRPLLESLRGTDLAANEDGKAALEDLAVSLGGMGGKQEVYGGPGGTHSGDGVADPGSAGRPTRLSRLPCLSVSPSEVAT